MAPLIAPVIAFMGTTALTVGGVAVTYGGLMTAAAIGIGGAAMMSDKGGGTVSTVNQVADKTIPQTAEQLDAAKIGEDESAKRKRLGSKEKFKIEKEEPVEEKTGVKLDSPTKQPVGLQI